MARKKVSFRKANEADSSARKELLKEAYVKLGYMGSESDLTLPCLLGNIALVATAADGKIVGTIAATRDGMERLCVEEEFPDQIRTLRALVGRGNFVYVERLAVAEKYRDGKITKIFFAIVFLWSVLHVKAVVAVVNPRHKGFYTAKGFQEIGYKDAMVGAGIEKAPATLIVRFVTIGSFFHGIRAWIMSPITGLIAKFCS